MYDTCPCLLTRRAREYPLQMMKMYFEKELAPTLCSQYGFFCNH